MNFRQTLNESGYSPLSERAIYQLVKDWAEARRQFKRSPQQFKVWLGGVQDATGKIIDTDQAKNTAIKLISALRTAKNKKQDIGYVGDEIDKNIVGAIQLIVQGQKSRADSKFTDKTSDDIILGGSKFKAAQDEKYGF